MSKSKKWKPIKFSQNEDKEAIAQINQLIKGLTKSKGRLLKRFLRHHEDLSYFRDINNLLWATDVPEKVIDKHKVLFQIKF